MSEITQKYRKARVGVAKMGNSRMGLIPAVRDQAEVAAGAAQRPGSYYGHRRVTTDETRLGFTEVE